MQDFWDLKLERRCVIPKEPELQNWKSLFKITIIYYLKYRNKIQQHNSRLNCAMVHLIVKTPKTCWVTCLTIFWIAKIRVNIEKFDMLIWTLTIILYCISKACYIIDLPFTFTAQMTILDLITISAKRKCFDLPFVISLENSWNQSDLQYNSSYLGYSIWYLHYPWPHT